MKVKVDTVSAAIAAVTLVVVLFLAAWHVTKDNNACEYRLRVYEKFDEDVVWIDAGVYKSEAIAKATGDEEIKQGSSGDSIWYRVVIDCPNGR